jgi:hypothetical protein
LLMCAFAGNEAATNMPMINAHLTCMTNPLVVL